MFLTFKQYFNLELTKQSLSYVELKLLLIRRVENGNNEILIGVDLSLIQLEISTQTSFILRNLATQNEQKLFPS